MIRKEFQPRIDTNGHEWIAGENFILSVLSVQSVVCFRVNRELRNPSPATAGKRGRWDTNVADCLSDKAGKIRLTGLVITLEILRVCRSLSCPSI